MPSHKLNLGGVLEDKGAKRLFKKVGDNQGATLGRVSEMAAIPKEEAQAHLEALEKSGMVAHAKVAGKKRYFTTDFLEGASDVVDDNESAILEHIPENDYILLKDLRARTGLPPWTLKNDLEELCSKNLVERKMLRNREEGFRLRFSREFYRENILTLRD